MNSFSAISVRDNALTDAHYWLVSVQRRAEDLLGRVTYAQENPGVYIPDANSVANLIADALRAHEALAIVKALKGPAVVEADLVKRREGWESGVIS